MNQAERLRQVATWLVDLANLCVGSKSTPDFKTTLTAYSSLLVEEFPPEAFCRESLVAVNRECKFFPACGEISKHLSAWWRDNRPHANLLALGAPSVPVNIPEKPEPPTSEAMEYVSGIVSAFKAERAAISSTSPQAKPKAEPRHLPDTLLLREYEKLASDGDACAQTRASILRRKLGIEAHV